MANTTHIGETLENQGSGVNSRLMHRSLHRLEPTIDGIPMWHAVPLPHDESRPHAHALTSLILFNGPTVTKIYAPGWIPRALYWLAFQAPFPYMRNRAALDAAILRRNLAGLLTEYWYGERRVARALGLEETSGRLGLVGEFIEGTEPTNPQHARCWLFDLTARFDEVGLPTWQVDPRQPRSLGNIIERPDGSYAIIDLESGLVSPLASPRAWRRAFRRGSVPIFDEVYFDLTRAYVDHEAPAMRAARGDAWISTLYATLDAAEAAEQAWHAGEPRIWRWLVRRFWTMLGAGLPPAGPDPGVKPLRTLPRVEQEQTTASIAPGEMVITSASTHHIGTEAWQGQTSDRRRDILDRQAAS